MTTTSGGTLGPVQERERIEALDILRGFALFGILLVNITHYLDWFVPYASRADDAVEWLVKTFAVDKFYPLFSFLFGVGFAIQLTRAEARQIPWVHVYLRRLVVLLVIGVAFFAFVEREQILMWYAVLGAPLLLFRNLSRKALLVWAVAFVAIHPLSRPVQTAVRLALAGTPEQRLERDTRHQVDQVLLEEATIAGNYGAVIAARARALTSPLTFVPFLNYGPRIFSMFLLGLYALRRGVFDDTDGHRRFLRGTLYWTAGVWIAATIATGPWGSTLRTTLWLRTWLTDIGATALTISYVAAIVCLLRWSVTRRVVTLLGWTGRMGLTNYVLHFVIVTTIFYGYGLGLYVGPGQAMAPLLAVVITLVPIPLSVWWLRRFRFGPLEWLWRSLTYGRRQPLLVAKQTRSAARVPYLRATVVAIAVLGTGVSLALWEPADRRRADEAAIAKLENEWRSALVGANTAAMSRIAAIGYTGRSIFREHTTLSQLTDSIASGALRFDAITPDRVTVIAHDHTASASGREKHVASSRGERIDGDRRFVRWYVKRDGQWHLTHDLLSRVF